MMRSNHLAGFAILITLAVAPVARAASASVSGLVRDSSGVPQIGAEVQLLRPDLSVVAVAYTNAQGRFLISSLMPGRYALKAMGPSFLPSLRENVRVRSGTIVNLTLNTLYEVIQWLPADPRAGNAQKDDWAWTLRSAANRPLLRWLEDGPLVVVSDGSGSAPKLKARLVATGQSGTFGESGERISATVVNTPSDSRELLAQVDFAPDSDAAMESMLGFRQDLGFAGSVQSVAAVSIQPGIEGGNNEGLEEAAVTSSETMHLGPAIEAEVGATAVMARLAGASPEAQTDVLPYANIAWHDGAYAVRYRMATMVQNPGSEESHPSGWLPVLAARNGELAIERGLHQDFGLERATDDSNVAVRIYSDTIDNPVLQALGRFAVGESAAMGNAVLYDPTSHLIRTAGQGFSAVGVQATLERRLHGDTRVKLTYATGSALAMPAMQQPAVLSQLIAATRPRRAQTYSIAFSGTLDGTGTHWRASYTWQPDDTVTAVAPFAIAATAPFLNIQVRQPIHITRDGSGGIEALLDVRNLLAEGYQPYILSDGSLLIFAQNQRSLRAGLAFTF